MRRRTALLLLLLPACGPKTPPLEEALGCWNRGVALMERHEPARAADEFRRVVELAPDWVPARVNLAVALLNSQKDENYAKAEAAFREVLRRDAANVRARYGLGLLHLHFARFDEAARELREVEKHDPDDPHTLYHLGSLAQKAGRPDEAEALFRRCLERQPAFASALYGLSRVLIQKKREDEAKTVLARFEELEKTKSGVKVGLKYTEMGPYGDVIRLGAPGTPAAPPPAKVAFEDVTAPPGFAAAAPLARAEREAFAGSRHLRFEAGKFVDAGLHVAGLVTCAAFADVDGDGDLDLFVGGPERSRLYLRDADHVTDGAAAAGLAEPARAAAWADLDGDGDLDLATPGRLFANLATGAFRPVPLPPGGEAARSIVPADLDGDGDADLLEPGGRLLRNDRALRFTVVPAPLAGASAAVCADVDGDGLLDVVLLAGGAAPARLLRNRARLVFEPEDLPARGAAAAAADADNDGDLDLLLGPPLRFLRNDGAGRFIDDTAAVGLASIAADGLETLAAADLDGDGAVEFLGAGARALHLRVQPPPGHHWLGLRLASPKPASAQPTWRNLRGAGALVEVKAGGRALTVEAGADGWVHAGLGPRAKADYVRVAWPSGTLQSELELPGDRVAPLEEFQRKASSCPVLFTWDGARFACVTDFLGVGGLGFWTAPGEYAPPDPTEDVRIPPGMLVERDGALEVRVVEPLEEVCYLDRLALLAVEHDADVEVHPDERLAAAPPEPDGRLLAVREKVFPVAARDLAGRDVRALVLEADRRGTGCEKDPRWPGYAKEHALELDFGDRRPAGEVFLFLDGWVEYTYSRFNYAAHQAGVRLEAPSLEVPDGNGGWRTVLRELGYPAGLPRTMTVPLPAEAGARFRLRTNMEVSWDRAFLARDLGAAAVRVTVLEAREATLRACGYPREFSPDGRDPTTYDYERREAGVTFRDLTGAYTRFGDVRELLLEADDRYAIFGRGEEVAAAFPALPPVAAGRARTYVLRSFGWCKDRDPYTAFPDTVEPLPFRGMGAYPYGPGARPADPAGFEAARRAWHTRRIR